MSAPSRAERPRPGPPLLGRYRPCVKVAAGGMASVHVARVEDPEGFGGVVALKIVHPNLGRQPRFVDMFHDEARLASLIEHRNVCRVFDIGEQDGTWYLAMEYLLGETLGDVFAEEQARRDAYTVERLPYYAAAVMAQVCDGLHAAHELRDHDGVWLGVVHRDVSPQNLFVGYDGRVKVVDFGLAKAARRVSQTQAGIVKGKYAYLAPESIQGSTPDRRVDIWAAGVCLWELLTLERLFHRNTDMETVYAVRDESPPAPRSLAWWVPPELDAIVQRALARNPAERFGTAGEMAHALRAFLVRKGRDVCEADLADWMAELFGAQRDRRLTVLEEVMGEPLFDHEGAPRRESSGPSLVDEPSPPRSRPRLHVDPEDLLPERPRRGRSPWPWMLTWMILALGAVLAGGALAAFR